MTHLPASPGRQSRPPEPHVLARGTTPGSPAGPARLPIPPTLACPPIRHSPVLERLANEAAGAWVLAKVDVDANPQLSAALQVQSIPMVLGVIGGQLVPGFLGALPEAQVREWLGQVLQVAQQLGLPGAGDG